MRIIEYGDGRWGVAKDLYRYVRRNAIKILLMAAALGLIFGTQIFTTSPRIDSMIMLLNQGSSLNWLEIGRPGLILTKIIFGMMGFTPYCAGVAFFLALVAVSILFGYLFEKVSGVENGLAMVAFSVLFFAHPMWADQFYFTLQNFEFLMGLLFSILAALSIFYAIGEKKPLGYVIGIPLLVWSFLSYQLLVVLYAALLLFSFMLLYIRAVSREERPKWGGLILRMLITFAIAAVLSSLISKLFFSSSAYLDAMIGTVPFREMVLNLFHHIKQALCGDSYYYTVSYVLSIAAVALSCVCLFFKKHRRKTGILFFVALFLLECTPFVMTVLLGHSPTYRVQLLLPFVIACNFYLAYLLLRRVPVGIYSKVLLPVVLALALTSGWVQTMRLERFFYSDDIRTTQETQLLTQISLKIGETTGTMSPNKAVVFVGYREVPLNSACLQGDLPGRGVFLGSSHYPYPAATNAIRFANVCGYHYKMPSFEEFEEAQKKAKDMPVFPAIGSIVETETVIIVKVGDEN